MSTLKVLFNYGAEQNDENNFSGNTFVSTAMLLVINMFANDLKMPLEYFSKISLSHNVDIYVNVYDNDGVYDNSSVEMIWPHYQNRYCLVYANTRKTPSDGINFYGVFNMLNMIVWAINWIFFYLLFRYRVRKTTADAFGHAFSYSLSSEIMMPIQPIETTVHEKFFLGTKFMQNIFRGTIFLTLFSSQVISPLIKLVTDDEIEAIKGNPPEPINDFGIGEQCLHELRQGLYLRRGCFLACDVANKTAQKHSGVVFLKEEINFQQVFKVSKRSEHIDTIKKLVLRYFEAGMLDRIFNDIHQSSHKFLEETRYADQIDFRDLYTVSKNLILFGYCSSIFILICELFYSKWKQARNHKQKFKRTHLEDLH